MKVAIGSDHAGFGLKEVILTYLQTKGVYAEDFGCYSDKQSVDYPDIAQKVGRKTTTGEFDLGVLVCGTGAGMAIAANKVRGIRAVSLSDVYTAEYTRRHNNANILCLGARVIGPGLAITLVDKFLFAEFDGDRHEERVKQILTMEKNFF